MHPKVLSQKAWTTIRKLTDADLLEPWTLAGGTALALQIGHRYSEDLGFCRADAFDPEGLLGDLSAVGPAKIQSRTSNTLHVLLSGLRISFLRAQAPFLFPGLPYRRLLLADPRDIAVMNVIAIGARGSRRDFLDFYFCLQGGMDLDGIVALLRRRFLAVDYNEYHLMKSLVYFDDAEAEPMPRMIKKVEWESVKKAIVAEVRRTSDGDGNG